MRLTIAAFRHTSLCLLLVIMVAAGGCGKPTAEISGTVSYKSAPVKRGEISFIAADGASASGIILEDGTYLVKNAPVGELIATVRAIFVEGEAKFGVTILSKAPEIKPAVPERFNDPSTSGLKYKISSGSQIINVELKDD